MGIIRAIAVQPDDRIVVTGDNISSAAVVGRYLSDGSLDPSFPWHLTGAVLARALLIQPDGRIVAAGIADNNMAGASVITRFQPDGGQDAVLPHPGTLDFAEPDGLALQSDGALVIGGETHCGNSYCFGLVRYRPDGTLDTTFGGGGLVATAIGGQAFVRAVILQPDGKILVGGLSELVRYDRDGSLDTSFGGGDGIIDVPVVEKLALYPDGKWERLWWRDPMPLWPCGMPDRPPDRRWCRRPSHGICRECRGCEARQLPASG